MGKTNGPCANKAIYEKIKTVDNIPYSVPHNLTKDQLIEFYMVCIKILNEAGETERANICIEKLKAIDDHQEHLEEVFKGPSLEKLKNEIKAHRVV